MDQNQQYVQNAQTPIPNQQYQQPYQPEPPKSRSAMGIVSLVLGIIAVLTSFLPIINNFSALLAFIGLIFGIIGIVITVKNKCGGKGLSIAGLILNIVAIIVVLASQAAYSAAIDAALSTSSQQSSQQQSSQEAQQATTVQNEATYPVTIDGCEIGQDYEGKKAAIVTYTWTNNSEKDTSFMVAIRTKAFQNGVQLDSAIGAGVESQDTMNDIKPGVTQTVQAAYVLDDDSEMTVEVSETFSLGNELITEASFAVA